MKDKLREVLANPKYGKDVVTKVLNKHGATKVGDVAPEDRAKVIATCDSLLAKK